MSKYTFKSSFATDFEYIPPKNGRPTILYLHGFCSNCWGRKPETVKQFCLETQTGLFRFDYAGHGADVNNFSKTDFKIWKEQALEIIDEVIKGDVICIGSSMGGWISILMALARPDRVKGIIGLAAAPNFVRFFENIITAEQKKELQENGEFKFANKDFTYTITQRFIDTAMANCLPEEKEKSWAVKCPVHLIQGMQDASLPWHKAIDFAKFMESPNVKIKLLKSSNHRLNDDEAIEELRNSLINIVNI